MYMGKRMGNRMGKQMGRFRVFASAFLGISLITTPAITFADGGSKTVTVFAASSLTRAYTALGAAFQTAHPGVTIKFSFGSSTTLATQINSGAPADIFASADVLAMTSVFAQFPAPINYVSNQVVVAVSKSSNISTVVGLNGSTKWLQCSHTVPCGIAADAAIKVQGTVITNPVSLESSDANALAKLLAGSVDAAIVYRTDVIANSTKLKAIFFSDPVAASTEYQLGISHSSASAKNHWAKTVYDYLTGHNAKKFLAASGFMISQ